MAKSLDMDNLKSALLQNNIKMKEWVNSQIGDVKVITIEWVETLPTENISTATIYMLKDANSTKENNIYVEYVYKEDTGWEILGTVDAGSVDLANYYNKEEVDNLLANLTMESYTDEEITAMVDEVWSE